MIEQLKTIREALIKAHQESSEIVPIHHINEALSALTQLEAMVGEQESSLAFYKRRCDALQQWQSKMRDPERTVVCDILANGHTLEPAGDRYAAPVAQQPQARPDFTDEWTGYLKDGETPFERFLRERKDLNALIKLYQRVLEENERLKGQQPQAEPDIHEAQGQIEFLDKKNNALSAAIRKVMARLADLLDEDQFKEIEEIVSFAGVQPQAEAAHRYVLELPDGDKREVKIYWIERQETAGEITHRLCVAVDAAPQQAEAVQACGHPMSLLLRSAESNEPLYCEACDDKSGRHDAERLETELLDANRRLQEKIASADALKLHAIEELCQLGYTVKDGELIPPDHLHKLVEAAGHPLAAPQQAEAVPPDVVRDADVEAAAKKMAEIFDYPWDFMPEKGRNTMRENVRAVLDAAIAQQKGQP